MEKKKKILQISPTIAYTWVKNKITMSRYYHHYPHFLLFFGTGISEWVKIEKIHFFLPSRMKSRSPATTIEYACPFLPMEAKHKILQISPILKFESRCSAITTKIIHYFVTFHCDHYLRAPLCLEKNKKKKRIWIVSLNLTIEYPNRKSPPMTTTAARLAPMRWLRLVGSIKL